MTQEQHAAAMVAAMARNAWRDHGADIAEIERAARLKFAQRHKTEESKR